jgi:hypothetical protein
MTGQATKEKTVRPRGVRMRVSLGASTIDALDEFIFEHRFSPARARAARRLTVSRLCEIMVRACAPALARELADEDAGHTESLVLLSTPTRTNARFVGLEFDPNLCFELDRAAVTTRTRRGRRELVARCVTAMTQLLSTPGSHALSPQELLELFARYVSEVEASART